MENDPQNNRWSCGCPETALGFPRTCCLGDVMIRGALEGLNDDQNEDSVE